MGVDEATATLREPAALVGPRCDLPTLSRSRSQLLRRRRVQARDSAEAGAPPAWDGVRGGLLSTFDARLSAQRLGWWQDPAGGHATRSEKPDATASAGATRVHVKPGQTLPRPLVRDGLARVEDALLPDDADPFKARTVHCRETEQYQRRFVRLAGKPVHENPWQAVHTAADVRSVTKHGILHKNAHTHDNGLPSGAALAPPPGFSSPLKGRWALAHGDLAALGPHGPTTERLDGSGKQLWLDRSEILPLYSSFSPDKTFRERPLPRLPAASASGTRAKSPTTDPWQIGVGEQRKPPITERATVFAPSEACIAMRQAQAAADGAESVVLPQQHTNATQPAVRPPNTQRHADGRLASRPAVSLRATEKAAFRQVVNTTQVVARQQPQSAGGPGRRAGSMPAASLQADTSGVLVRTGGFFL